MVNILVSKSIDAIFFSFLQIEEAWHLTAQKIGQTMGGTDIRAHVGTDIFMHIVLTLLKVKFVLFSCIVNVCLVMTVGTK